jgi:hypothetical protein
MLSLRIGLLGILIWTTVASSAEQARAPLAAVQSERQAVKELTSRFLTSFENLDMPAFIGCFAVSGKAETSFCLARRSG